MKKFKSTIYHILMALAMIALALMRKVAPEKIRGAEAAAKLNQREPRPLGKGRTRPVRRIRYR